MATVLGMGSGSNGNGNGYREQAEALAAEWRARTDRDIDTLSDSVTRLVSVVDRLEARVQQHDGDIRHIRAAPERLRDWVQWAIAIVSFFTGGCGCMGVVGVSATIISIIFAALVHAGIL